MVYFTMLAVSQTTASCMVGKLMREELEGIVHGPSWHMPRGTEEYHENPQSVWPIPQPKSKTEHFLIKVYSITAKN
jgi:hypothetical protein